MFRRRGYKATSMRDIAAVIGMEAPSLYNHITGKQQILGELLMMIANAFTDGMKEIASAPLSSKARLEHLIILHVDITIDHTDAVSLLTNEWVHLEGKIAKDFAQLKDNYEKDFATIIEACRDEGVIKEVNIELAMFSMLSTLRWLYSWYSKNPRVNKIALEQQMIKLLIPLVD